MAHDPIHPPGSPSKPPSDTLKPVILIAESCQSGIRRSGHLRNAALVTGSLEQLVPKDHVLARVDRVLDLGWLHEEVTDCYCPGNGRPGIGLVYL